MSPPVCQRGPINKPLNHGFRPEEIAVKNDCDQQARLFHRQKMKCTAVARPVAPKLISAFHVHFQQADLVRTQVEKGIAKQKGLRWTSPARATSGPVVFRSALFDHASIEIFVLRNDLLGREPRRCYLAASCPKTFAFCIVAENPQSRFGHSVDIADIKQEAASA